MPEERHDSARRPAPKPADDKHARLAAALRDNLKRRKAQARARAEDPKPEGRE